MITIYVRGIYLPGFEIIPALSMIARQRAVAGRRFINIDDEEDEWRESAPGLDSHCRDWKLTFFDASRRLIHNINL